MAEKIVINLQNGYHQSCNKKWPPKSVAIFYCISEMLKNSWLNKNEEFRLGFGIVRVLEEPA